MKKYVNFGCVSLGKSENGSLIQDRLDHGASKEPMNPPGKGFFGLFDALWSKRSWINNPFSDFPKETHPSSKPLKGFPPCSINLALHLLMFWTIEISFHSYYWVIVLMPEFVNNFIQIKHFGIMAWSGRRRQSFVLLRRKSIMEICTKHNMKVKNTFMINKSQIVHLSSLAQACE